MIRVAQIDRAGGWDALLASLPAAVGARPVHVATGPATTAAVARGDEVADRLALAG